MKDLINFGSITLDVAMFLEACIRGRLNVMVSGGTGTGKTTVLNVLTEFVPESDRIVTIEDAAELRLSQPHVVTLESRPSNIEGAGQVTIRDLVRNALRMRPDRIVVGEVRGAEALDMLQAMNTGHEGSLTTIHCNSPRDALARLETMVLMAGYDLPLRAIRQQVASALDIIIHLDRFGDGSRHVTHVSEVQGMEGDVITLQDIFRYTFAEGGRESSRSVGRLRPTGLRPKIVEKLQEAGVGVPPKFFRPTQEESGSYPLRSVNVQNGRRN
jgi:pilus assembly protein CpaF